MEKRYQVFVSSTYEDLVEERQEVMQALLELDCMPSGMELFPATNDDQWTLIKNVIDDCDYYIVIIGGRYGSIGPSGTSYTQMEYQYATERGKPVIAFLHKDPGSLQAKKTEKGHEGREKLENFRSLAQQKMCKFWSTPTELGSVVSRSLVKLIKTNPAIGWVKADLVPEQSATEEILKLKNKIEELEQALAEASSVTPRGTENLAQGEDLFVINFSFDAQMNSRPFDVSSFKSSFKASWNEVFSKVSPLMIDETTESGLKKALNDFCKEVNLKSFVKRRS